MISRLCGILKKNDTNELIYKIETQTQRMILARGKDEEKG